jgi:hypothetical protein
MRDAQANAEAKASAYGTDHGRKGSGVTETEKLRHYCRNPHCRMKFKAPVENDHAAFCCRGCFTRFYRRRCLVCERDLSRDPMTGEAVKLGRKFCGQKCQREHRRFPRVYSVFASGSYTPSAEHRSDSKSAHSTGLKTRLRVVRGSGNPAVEHRIGPDDYPVNILGGHRWPDAPKLGSTIETVLWKEVGPLTDLTAYDLPEAA